jgi:hypothetical protein
MGQVNVEQEHLASAVHHAAHMPIHRFLYQIVPLLEQRAEVAKKCQLQKDDAVIAHLQKQIGWVNEEIKLALAISPFEQIQNLLYPAPTKQELPMIMHDKHIDRVIKYGLDGTNFKIPLSRRMDNNRMIKCGYGQPILYITSDKVNWDKDNESWVHTVQIVTNDPCGTFFPWKYLMPGTQFDYV